MQLFAYNASHILVPAAASQRGGVYRCPECGQRLGLRKGKVRREHFYHLTNNEKCRQAGKSEAHLAVQKMVQDLWGEERCRLERRFPQISRIADICIDSERVVIEVQCSAIDPQEVRARNRDYEQMGYRVVWIFHDGNFNRRRLTAGEAELEDDSRYYTDGKMIYDQLELFQGGERKVFMGPTSVDPSVVRSVQYFEGLFDGVEQELPVTLARRYFTRKVFFGGDLLELFLTQNFLLGHPGIQKLFRVEKKKSKAPEGVRAWYLKMLYKLLSVYSSSKN